MLDSVARDPAAESDDQWVCHLRGTPKDLTGQRLLVSVDDKSVAEFEIPPFAALQKEVELRLPAPVEPVCYTIRLQTAHPHPWLAYNVTSQNVRTTDAGRTAVLADGSPESVLGKKIVSAALQAANPAIRLTHCTVETGPAQMPPEIDMVVVVVRNPLPTTVQGWLETQTLRGATVLWLPTQSARPINRTAAQDHGTPDVNGFVPQWGDPIQTNPETDLPLDLTTGYLTPNRLQNLMLSGLPRILSGTFLPPVPPANGHTLLATQSGKPVLVAWRPHTGAVCRAFGIPLVPAADSPLFHPLFPHVLLSLLGPGAAAISPAFDAEVGKPVDLAAFFGREHIDGTLRFPDGHEQHVVAGPRRPVAMYFPAPGTYLLQTVGDTVPAAVNFPRPGTGPDVSVDRITDFFGETRVTWLGDNDPIPLQDARVFGRATGDAGPDPNRDLGERRYDLSMPLAAILLIGMFVEALAVMATRTGDA